MHFEFNSSDFSVFGHLLFWYFVPNLLTRIITSTLSFTLRIKVSQKAVYVTIVVLYLAASFIYTEATLPPSLYSRLSLPVNVDDSEVRSQYRKLSRTLHPDKLIDHPDREKLSAEYVFIQQAHEILKVPAKRWAYDRFGESVVESCSYCKTEREYIMHGLTYLIFYSASVIITSTLNILGRLDYGTFWRYTGLLILLWLETSLLYKEDFGSFLFPHRTIHEKIQLIHQVGLAMFVALGQVGPVIWPVASSVDIKATLTKLYASIAAIELEGLDWIQHTYKPFANDAAELREHMLQYFAKRVVDDKMREKQE